MACRDSKGRFASAKKLARLEKARMLSQYKKTGRKLEAEENEDEGQVVEPKKRILDSDCLGEESSGDACSQCLSLRNSVSESGKESNASLNIKCETCSKRKDSHDSKENSTEENSQDKNNNKAVDEDKGEEAEVTEGVSKQLGNSYISI